MAQFKTHQFNPEQSQFTSDMTTSYNDEGLTPIGLKLREVDKDQTINFKHNGKWISVRKKLSWAKKSLLEQSVVISGSNLLTYFDVRAGEPTGEGSGGGLSTIAYQEQFEFVDNLTAGFNLTQLVEGSLILTKNRVDGTLEEVKLYKLGGIHNANTITLRIKDIGANESTSDTVLATFTTTTDSSNTLTATLNNMAIAANKQLYIHAANPNTNMKFIIVSKYNG